MTENPYTLAQAAKFLNCSTKTVRRLVTAGKLACIRYTNRGKIYIDRDDVEVYQNACKTGPKQVKQEPQKPRTKRPHSSQVIPREEWGKM